MAVSLKKGDKFDLTKANPGLSDMLIGLGWDTNKYDGGFEFDLDASTFLLGEDGNVIADTDFVFYGNKSHVSGAVWSHGDNRDGEGDGDDEIVSVLLHKIPASIQKVAITVSIHEAAERNQNFGQVSNAYVRVVNEANGTEVIRYDLEEDFSVETAVVVGEIYRKGAEWKFNAVGSGFSGGLAALCRNYGIDA